MEMPRFPDILLPAYQFAFFMSLPASSVDASALWISHRMTFDSSLLGPDVHK